MAECLSGFPVIAIILCVVWTIITLCMARGVLDEFSGDGDTIFFASFYFVVAAIVGWFGWVEITYYFFKAVC